MTKLPPAAVTVQQKEMLFFFFLNDRPTTEISPLPPHDALPIGRPRRRSSGPTPPRSRPATRKASACWPRSEEHTSELQSLAYLVCRLLLEKKRSSFPSSPMRKRCGPWPSATTASSRDCAKAASS